MIIYLVNFSFDHRHRARVVHVKTAAFAFQITKRINIIVLARRDIRIIIARQVNIDNVVIFVSNVCTSTG